MNVPSASGTVYWITGLSGAGKTTLANALHAELRERGAPAVLVDGDAVRELLLADPGMDRDARLRIARFNGRLCRFLAQQGLTVVCATISLFHAVQTWNRSNIGGYVEVFLNASLAQLERRDPTGLYARARAGTVSNVVGLDIEPEWPQAPDFTFSTDGTIATSAMVAAILARAEEAVP